MTDHKAEAVRLASLADGSYGAIEHRNGADAASEAVEALMIATEAQVHATLYLAEQQRIANLIALGQFSHKAEGDTRVFQSVHSSESLMRYAAKALGLS